MSLGRRYDEFGMLKTGVWIAVAIGVAAALASPDDAGRGELIGLAATAHITILPASLGIALVFGMPDAALLRERALGFAVNGAGRNPGLAVPAAGAMLIEAG